MATIENVEVFRSGIWNSDRYDESDLDAMVDAFSKAGFVPPVKLGHSDETGSPAFGWVQSLRRVGDRLVATLRDLPDKIFQAIRDRRYDAVSCEILWDLTRDGKKFPRVLGAVALLGSEIPAVSSLKPLFDSLRGLASADFAECRVYQFQNEEKPMLTTFEAGCEIDHRTRQLMATTSLNYAEAQRRVLAADDELKHAYAGIGQPCQESAGDQVHDLIQANMRATGRNYAEAMRAVLADPANAQLKAEFGQKGY